MTREQAYAAMQDGSQITHQYFTKDEYYELKGNKIIAEDGVNHTSVFWEWDFKKDGWSIFEEADKKTARDRVRAHIILDELLSCKESKTPPKVGLLTELMNLIEGPYLYPGRTADASMSLKYAQEETMNVFGWTARRLQDFAALHDIEDLANKFGVFGACKSTDPDGCENDDPFCCRVGFCIVLKDRIYTALENEKKLNEIGLI